MNRILTALFLGSWLLRGQTLMQEPLGDTTEPKVSLSATTLPPGYAGPSHQHAGVVFIYVLEGEIESQVEPGAVKIYHAGEFFHERPNQVHRIFRNLSATAPARFLNFSNIDTQKVRRQDTGTVTSQLLLEETLADLANQEVNVVRITSAPGSAASNPHQHPGPVFAYLAKGEVESQVDPGEPKTYRAGDVFYEPPMHVHRMYRNLSSRAPAELIVFQVREKGKPLAIGAK